MEKAGLATGFSALFRLLMRRVLLAPFAELLELETGLERLLVLVGMVVHPLALGALQFDEVILRHNLSLN
jgi:hypothetical protein